MADRVYPSAKPNPQPPAAPGGGGGAAAAGAFPAPKSQMYQRPNYRPQPSKRRRRRTCRFSCCCCFLWTVLVVLLLAFVAAVAGGVFYLLYHPHRPTFSVSTARLAALNLSSAAAPSLTDAIDVTVTAKNPNKKLVFLYDDFAVTAATAANSVPLGAATVPGFSHDAGNTTVIKTTVSAAAVSVDPTAAASDIKKSGSFAIAVDLDTKAGVMVGSLKTKKIGIQVHCDGIKVAPPPPPPAKGKNGTALAPAAAEAAPVLAGGACQVRIRVKIWKWTF